MKKRLQVNAFVRFIMRVSILQIVLLTGIISISNANDLIAQKILEKRLTIKLDNTNLRAALLKIEKQTGATFIYQSQVIPKEKVNIRLDDETLEQALNKILLPRGIVFEADGTHIILARENKNDQSLNNSETEPEMGEVDLRITGTITDDLGGGLPGVNIIVKGTSRGTTADSDGSYVISVDDTDAILVFSFIGYTSQEVAVGSQTVINVKMASDISTLDEIVVVGYGVQKKSSLTAAISTIKGEATSSLPVVNLSNSLAGRVAGVIVTQGSGEPGVDGSSIRIRGIGSNGNSAPLLVVDGIYRDFTLLDPSTIDTYTVLKDAAAVAPYGLAGANGVILVTTKKGKTGAPTLNYNTYVAFQNPTRVVPFVNSVEYALMRNEAAKNEGIAPVFSDSEIGQYQKTVNGDADADPDLYPNSRGVKDILEKNSLITYNHIDLSGGTDRVKYFAGIGYTTQQGQWNTTSVKKYNLMANIDAQVTNTTTISLKLNGWVSNNTYPASSADGLMYRAVRIPPTSAIHYSNGLWGQYVGGSLVGLAFHSGYERSENTSILTNLAIEQKLPFIKGLSVKGQMSYDPNYKFEKKWHTPIPVYTLNTSTDPRSFDLGYQGPAKPNLEERYSQSKAVTYQGYLNYARSFGQHEVTVLGVVESRNIQSDDFNSSIINYNSTIDELGTGSAAKVDYSIGGSSSTQKQFGYVYRVAYGFANKYMAEVAGRYDGHYAFAPGHQYSFFPAYSLSWNLHEESFIKNSAPMVDLLKLRASYGKSGNLPYINGNLASFQYLSSYLLYSSAYNFGNTPGQGLSESLQGNPNITWEKSTKYDIGLESSLWSGKLTLEADAFWEHRTDMLVNPANKVPLEYGVNLGYSNLGVMYNHGFEMTLGTSHVFTNGLSINVSGNFTYAKNKIVNILEVGATYDNPNRRQTGRALNTQFGYEALGYFKSDDFNLDGSLKEGMPVQPWGTVHPGDLKYADLSGPNGIPDGIISTDDQTVIGMPKTPQLMFGIMPNIAYKGFDLDLLFQGAAKNSIYIDGNMRAPFDGSSSATTIQFDNHWTPANTNALYPRLTTAPTANNTQGSSWWIRDGRYVRLKSFQFGYTFSPNLIQYLKIVKSVRFYVSGQNVFTWTPKLKETLDPEIGDKSNGQYYYQQKVFSIGANITF